MVAALGSGRGSEAADRLCEACVEELDVDAAAISLIFHGVSTATLGASGPRARTYDELQFTLGEGPCLDSVATREPVLIPDLRRMTTWHWPAYVSAMLSHRVLSVFAIPIIAAGQYIGALDLFRHRPGPLAPEELSAGLVAAEVAAMPLMDILGQDMEAAGGDPESDAWTELNALMRVEVSQATGVLLGQLDVDPAEALVRLRAHAYAANRSVTEVARDILDGRLRLDADA